MEGINNFVALYGNHASILGLALAVFGFGVTIYQTKKTRTSAKATETAVKKVREDIRRVDTISDLNMAISKMEHVLGLHRIDAWPESQYRYTELRSLLVTIRADNPDLTNDQKIKLQTAIQQIKNIQKSVGQKQNEHRNPLNANKLNDILSDQIDSLGEVLAVIRNKVGVNND